MLRSAGIVKTANWRMSIPGDIYAVLLSRGLARETLALQSHQLLAMRLFRTRFLSLAQAARLARLSKWDFIDLLGENDIPIMDYSEDELDIEFESLATLDNIP